MNIGAGATIFLLFSFVWIFTFVLWIVALVEVARIPEQQFRAAGSEKIMWVLIVVLTHVIGALVWRFTKRDDVLRAAGQPSLPPPGWYPEPATGSLRWWDGTMWTDARHAPPSP